MNPISLLQPGKIVFGNNCLEQFYSDLIEAGHKRIFICIAPEITSVIERNLNILHKSGVIVTIDDSIQREPTVEMFRKVLENAIREKPDLVAGIGGGSVLDVAKLVAGMLDGSQDIVDIFGNGLLMERHTAMVCLPTTSGTGSEVSPNAILLDEKDDQKKAVISPYLIPDIAYIDPILTKTVPEAITASTGLDALTHCIEAYVNNYSHPAVDTYALRGIELIGSNLVGAVRDGSNEVHRANLSLGSMYGGLCLGPVNTAAVHALAYPLGSIYHVAHGISNAILLPHVIRFNTPAAVQRYARIATALGVDHSGSDETLAESVSDKITDLLKLCKIPTRISDLNISRDKITSLAESAMKVTRLLNNNIKKITLQDARHIYEQAF